jgi:hypothetical protein
MSFKTPLWQHFFEGHSPIVSGWYPVLICYDPNEGCFPDSAEWDSAKGWLDGGPVFAFGPPMPTEKAALKWAIARDLVKVLPPRSR